MIETGGNVRSNQKLTEIRYAKPGSEGADSLFENLLPMSNEQKARLPLLVFEEPLEVECCHNRLSRPSRRHYQIAPVSVNKAFGFQSIQDSLLKRMRANVEKYRRNSLPRPRVFDGLSKYKWLLRVKR